MGGIFPDPGGHATSKKSRYGLRIAKFCDDDGRLLVNDPRRGTGRCRKIDHGIDLRENTPFTFYRIRGRTGSSCLDLAWAAPFTTSTSVCWLCNAAGADFVTYIGRADHKTPARTGDSRGGENMRLNDRKSKR